MSMIRTWCWDLTSISYSAPLVTVLSADERSRAECFKRDQDRRAYLAAHAGLRLLLSQAVAEDPGALRIAQTVQGKPYLADYTQLHFNLSHCRGYAYCAVADSPVGVDIERRKPMPELDAVLAHIATAEELTAIRAVPRTHREAAFFRLWVRKEALLKAIGIGIAEAAQTHQVGSEIWPHDGWQALSEGQGAHAPSWHGHSLLAPQNHEAAVVIRSGPNTPDLQQISLPADWLVQLSCALAS